MPNWGGVGEFLRGLLVPKLAQPAYPSLVYGLNLFLDPQEGDDAADGLSWDTALLTMAEALRRVKRGSVINLCGKLVEDGLVTPQGATDVTVIGRMSVPRSGSTGRVNGPKQGAANWRVNREDNEGKALLTVTQQGWAFYNIHFHNSRYAAALHFIRNSAGETSPEGFAGDHALINNCVFDGPGFGVISEGGTIHTKIVDSLFFNYREEGNFAIVQRTGEGVGYSLQWEITNNHFMGNVGDIKFGLVDSRIIGNVFQRRSVTAGQAIVNQTAMDLRNGSYNTVANNWMHCALNTNDPRFYSGTEDSWGPNYYTNGPGYGL